MTRRLACAFCCLLLFWLGACSGDPAEPGGETPEPSTPAGSASAPASPDSSASASTSSSAPAEGGEEGDSFTFEDAASFEDGVSLEVAFTLADKAKATDKGAETTKGQIVVFVLKLTNDSEEEYDPSDALITATYGDANTDAPIIVDETGELQAGFSDVVAISEEANAQVGFAIPAAESKNVTITIDLNDAVHDPVSFTGAAAQT